MGRAGVGTATSPAIDGGSGPKIDRSRKTAIHRTTSTATAPAATANGMRGLLLPGRRGATALTRTPHDAGWPEPTQADGTAGPRDRRGQIAGRDRMLLRMSPPMLHRPGDHRA